MFEKVLTRLREPALPRMPAYDWYKERDDGDEDEDEDEDDDERGAARWIEPTIPTFVPPPSPTKYVNLKGRRLQVIVKLANILLTPARYESLLFLSFLSSLSFHKSISNTNLLPFKALLIQEGFGMSKEC
jgi:hypothetical protein